MIKLTMNARKVRFASKTLCVFSLSAFVLLFSEVGGSLLDPTQIGGELQKFARDALGVDEMQNYFDSLQYQKKIIKGEDIRPHLAVKLSDKFKARFQVAKRLKKAVEDSYARSAKAAPQTECCHINKSTLKYDVRFHSRVDLENVCLKISDSASPNPTHLDAGVLNEMKDISKTYPFIKWQYFGSEQGVMTNFPVFDDKEECDKYDPRYRPFYVETATPEAKDVVLVVDISASMTGEKLYIAKEAAKTVLDTMNPKDKVGIVAFNNYASTPGDVGGKSRCYSERLALAIPTNIRRMKSYVEGLVPHGQTQYRLAFEKAFSLLKGSVSGESGEKKKRVILFLTDGAPSDEKKELIFHTIRDKNFELNNSVIILTYGFGSAVNETTLEDIAKQNTAKHGAPANTSVGDITPGEYTYVKDIKNLRIKMGMYYNLFALGEQLDPVVSVPYVDAFGTGLLMSITLPCFHEGKFIGVAGTDINMDDLLSDITFFNQGQSTYAFMTSNSGRTLIHPLLPAPTDAYGDPVFLDIRTLEPEKEFEEVFDSMKRGKPGSKTFVAKRFLPKGAKEKEGVTVKEVNTGYFWTPLAGIDFSVGVAVPVSHGEDQLISLTIPADYSFKYHRIDLDHPDKPCSQFGTYAAKDTTVVKFAPGAYKDPYEYIGKDETEADVELLNAYMKDETGAVINPGLKNGIRDTVIATWHVEDLWLRDKTELTQYLVWRYIGTSNGVFRVTPGTVHHKGYDPRQRPWYYTALAHTGLLTLTTPYLDSLGAGVVITAGRTLYRGEPSHIHHTNDEVLGVMGIDFPLTYFHRLLTEVYPKCKDTQTYSCFVMDSAGFLIMHEDFLLSSAEASDVEYVHITEKDIYVAEDLITKGHLRKKECRDLEEIQKLSFYEVSLGSGGIDTLRSGGRCSKYQLQQIKGTNAYIGVAVREPFCSADSCPCSSDRECSLFNLTCECPCTSPLDFHYCRSQFLNSSDPICPPSAPETQPTSNQNTPVPKKMCKGPTSGLEKCFDPRCSERNSSQSCEGVVGCYWCRNDKADVPLKQPYCASSEVCYRGREAEEQCPIEGPKTTSHPSQGNRNAHKLVLGGDGGRTGVIVGTVVGCSAVVALIVALTILVIRHRRNLGGPPINNKESAPRRQIDLTARPPEPLPAQNNDGYDEEDYDDPDELQCSRKPSVISVQWPSPYDEIRVRPNNTPPALPPERKKSTTSTQINPRPLSFPISYHMRTKEKESSGYPQLPVPETRRTSTTAMNSAPRNSVTGISSTESKVPEVPKKKGLSLVIPPPTISEEKRPYELSSQAASKTLEHQYSNIPSPRPEPNSPSNTRLMPHVTEAMEESISDRPGLSQRESCSSIALDPHGYIKFIASEGERLSEDQPLGPASHPNVLTDGSSSSAVLNSPVPESRDPSDTSLIPHTADTEQCVPDKPGLPQRESCDSIALDPQGYVKCISQNAQQDTI